MIIFVIVRLVAFVTRFGVILSKLEQKINQVKVTVKLLIFCEQKKATIQNRENLVLFNRNGQNTKKNARNIESYLNEIYMLSIVICLK